MTDSPQRVRLIDAGPLDIQHQVALDAACLALVDAAEARPCWRFWEVPEPAVVIGSGGTIEREVILERARAENIPLVRRSSGGGAVVQTPGILNYSVVLAIADRRELERVDGSYRQILGVVLEALHGLGVDARFEPPSDLAVGEWKISGNAQARKKSAVLVHGTVLVSAETGLFARYLKHPPAEPAYRKSRPHEQFVVTLRELGLSLTSADLAAQITRQAGLDPESAEPPTDAELAEATRLVETRFSQDSWNLRR